MKIELYQTAKEREAYDEQANLYSIIMTTEHLERAYARDAVTQKDYYNECKKLISQYRVARRALDSSMTAENFMALYQMDCPLAKERLDKGVPESGRGDRDDTGHAVTVAETVQHFITAMDAVKLDQRAVDDLQPLLSDLLDVLTRLPDTPNDFEPNRKVQYWIQKLNNMRAVDEIDDADSRQLYHDLDSAYGEFKRYLSSH